MNDRQASFGASAPHGSRVEDFAPILEELLQTLVGQRMVEKLIQNLEWHGSDMRSGQRRFNHVRRRTQRRRQYLRLETVVAIDLHDAADQVHARVADIVQTSDKRADNIRPG